MDKIIYLETDEEITSVVDKLRKIKTRDIILVAPKRCTLVQSIVNLKLLKKQAKLLSKKIVLVTSDLLGQNLATKAGIPTKKELEGEEIALEEVKPKVEKPKIKIEKPKKPKEEEIVLPKIEKIKRVSISDIVAKMEKEKVKEEPVSREVKSEKIEPREKKPKEIKPIKPPRVVLLPSFNVKMFFVFLGITLFVCVIVGLVILPSCTIAIVPKAEPLLKELEVVVAKDRSLDIENNVLGGEVKSHELESAYKTFKATGQKEIKEKARGKVIVYNSYSSESQVLEAGSRLRSSNGLMYLTLAGIEIPGARIEGGGTIPGSHEVQIESEEAGEEYNAVSVKFTIPSLSSEMQKAIWAENKEKISGGKSEKIKVVTARDIQDAQSSLAAELTDRAKKELQAKISKGERFQEEAINKEVQIVDINAQEGSEVGEFKMKIKVRMEALVYKEKDIETLIEGVLEKLIPKEKYVLDQASEGISYETAGFDQATYNLRLKIHIQKTVAWKIDKKKIKEQLSGKDAEEAKEYLEKDPHIKEATVKFWPVWVKSVPYIEKKINVKEVMPE